MKLTLDPGGMTFQEASIGRLVAGGVPDAEIATAARAAARHQLDAILERFRAALSSSSPAKIGEFFVKEQIYLDETNADPAELALLDREAVARGMTRAQLIALIGVKAAAFRQTALLMAALEAEAKAAIAAIPDTPNQLEASIGAALQTARTEAAAAIASATQVIQGGT